MTDLRAYLIKRLRRVISGWKEDGIYAISFFVSGSMRPADFIRNGTESTAG